MTQTKDELTSSLKLMGFLLVIGVLGASIIGFAFTGFDTEFVIEQFTIYGVLFLAGASIILIMIVINQNIRKKDSAVGDTVFFNSPGKEPSFRLFKNFTIIQTIWFFSIILGILVLFSNYVSQTTFFGAGTNMRLLEQQFSTTGSVLYSTLIIPVAENMVVAAILAAVLTLALRNFSRKYNWSKSTFHFWTWGIGVATFLVVGVANHLLRYQGLDFALQSVAIFWSIGGVLTIATGSFIPFWLMHVFNNLYLDLRRFFSNDSVFIGTLFVIIALVISYFFVYRGRLLGGKKRVENEQN